MAMRSDADSCSGAFTGVNDAATWALGNHSSTHIPRTRLDMQPPRKPGNHSVPGECLRVPDPMPESDACRSGCAALSARL